MAKEFTRQELYDLVWSKPISKLAPEIGVSGVAIAKACDRADIPVPPRGYWARKAFGKSVVRATLPVRPPGMRDQVRIGGHSYWYYGPQLSDDDLLGPIPPEPEFERLIEDVQRSVEASLRKIRVPQVLEHPHPAVARVLKYDADRADKAREYRSTSSWYAPRYDTPIQRRRLRLASALFLGVASCGCRTDLSGGEPHDGQARDFTVHVGDQHVRVRLAVVERKHRTGKGAEAKTAVEKRIRISLNPGDDRRPDERFWEDGESRLETRLQEIAVAIIVRGEADYRDGVLRSYAWRIERRAALIEKRRKEKEEAERLERERLAELERRRVERLLGEAEALRKAEAIRRYVAQARERNASLREPMPSEDLDAWAGWALAQADRIDPLVIGAFRQSLQASDGLLGAGGSGALSSREEGIAAGQMDHGSVESA
jgi:hypothetical protein